MLSRGSSQTTHVSSCGPRAGANEAPGGRPVRLTSVPADQRRFGEPDAASASGYSIPSTRQSLITGFMSLGALIGALMIGYGSRRVGIKVSYLFSLFIYMGGVAIETSGHNSWVQEMMGRFVTGWGVGSLSLLAPLYQAECSPKHLRGLITGML